MRNSLAVVIVTTCRETLCRSVRSVFNQQFSGRMQILIGVDCDPHKRLDALLPALAAECPSHITITLINLGYSTSQRHGGPHASFYGGSLRSALTLLADSDIVIYLDDDDWLKEDHCARILRAIEGKKWAYSYSIYADGNTGEGLCVDEIESVGVGKGIYAKNFGGFVRPSGLAINKMQLLHIVHLWSCSAFATGDGEDRLIFEQLRNEPHGCTEAATVYCALDPKDMLHDYRVSFMRSKGVEFVSTAKAESTR
ncbi:glycosyltransferase family 2 protein [Noviherbaspirillum cavernae]|uniref:Glycosyltransferase family 2 protein n=1 Tax=Noviherbaspirillum cavernae TaxID=2320862 RepID=A0A418WZ88_9BURK|nr:glycosyltransferase family A protein [Noviherbaspirillum cavernae]RJG05395.1 glycosyltransferase family 2 protein [Noviherbaspirillum cavernae]